MAFADFEVKADSNVPFLPGRARYSIVGMEPAWVCQEMDAGKSFAKKLPTTVAEPDPTKLDPKVCGGFAQWEALNTGGIFAIPGSRHRPITVHEIILTNNAVLEIWTIDEARKEVATPGSGVKFRDPPTLLPFNISPGEVFVVASSDPAAKVSILMSINEERTF